MTSVTDHELAHGGLIPFETYLAGVLDQVEPLTPVRMGTTSAIEPYAAGLYVARAVTAVWDAPSFTNSAMDGFAVASTDLAAPDHRDGADGVVLEVSGDIAAGSTGTWTPGTAVRIMTGAPLPEGTDTVVPVEFTDHPSAHEPLPPKVRLPVDWPADRHVRHRGSDVPAGSALLPAGTRLDGAALAALTGVGVMSVPVRPKPRVAVIVTGDELMTLEDVSMAGGSLPDGRILNSNGVLVAETLTDLGAEIVAEETCSDDATDFDECLVRAWNAGVDMIVTTGGASVGAHDVARRVLGDLGVTFTSVGIQPGKPQGFGVLEGSMVCALPGNPGAVHASLHAIVHPVLAKLSGAPGPEAVPMTVEKGWSAKAGMRQFVPVVIAGGSIQPSVEGGVASHRVRSLARADGLASIAPDITEVRPGDVVPVIVTRPH